MIISTNVQEKMKSKGFVLLAFVCVSYLIVSGVTAELSAENDEKRSKYYFFCNWLTCFGLNDCGGFVTIIVYVC